MSFQWEHLHLYFLVLDCLGLSWIVLDCLGLSVRKLQVHLFVPKHTCTISVHVDSLYNISSNASSTIT